MICITAACGLPEGTASSGSPRIVCKTHKGNVVEDDVRCLHCAIHHGGTEILAVAHAASCSVNCS